MRELKRTGDPCYLPGYAVCWHGRYQRRDRLQRVELPLDRVQPPLIPSR
jgi:hypothetical protein